jgi:2-desacetyl-2-hydroxyethyl bacteriochlorophyllide A dehydrogenase
MTENERKGEMMGEMKAVIMHAPRELEVGSWEMPRPGPGEALVSVAATGICAGDMYVYTGKNPYVVYPQICGHEIAGTVVAVGDGVAEYAAGDRVVVEPFIGCGECYPCRVGKPNCCMKLVIIGMHVPGGFADYLTAPAANLYRIPEGMPFSLAAFAEPVAIGVQSCRRGGVSRGEAVLILGCGPIGLAILEVAKARGARVLAADKNPDRLETAQSLGAEALLADETLLPSIMERTGGEGMPVVLEATGSIQAMEATVDLVAPGGRIVIVGLTKRGLGVTFPALDFTRKEMTIVGSRASANCFPESLELLANGAITYPRVATEVDMWDAPRLFHDLSENPAAIHKGVLVRNDAER